MSWKKKTDMNPLLVSIDNSDVTDVDNIGINCQNLVTFNGFV